MREFVLTADYFQSEAMNFVSKVYVQEVGRPEQTFELFSIADVLTRFPRARFTVYALKVFARFLFDYLEKSGQTFGKDYTALITERGDVYSVAVRGVSFVSFAKRTCLSEDFEGLTFEPKATIPSMIAAQADKTLQFMQDALLQAFSMGLKKPTFSGNIKRDFCAGDKRRKAYLFPALSSYEFETCANSYKGGRAFINPEIHGDAIHERVHEYDIISAYPYYMRDFALPYGDPVRFEGKYEHDRRRPFYIQKLRAEIKLKDGFSPSLRLKDHPIFGKTRYITDTDSLCVTFCATSVELGEITEYYTFSRVEFLGGYKFRAAHGLFDEYLAKWYAIKSSAKSELEKHYAKHMLDNLGGFLGTRDDFVNLAPVLHGDTVYFERLPRSFGHNVYCPPIAFTTARLRSAVNTIIQHSNVLYTATDSFHVYAEDKPTQDAILNVYPLGNDMGCISLKRTYDYAKYLEQNFYIAHLENTDTMHVVAAGVPRKYNQSIARVNPGDILEIPGFIDITPAPGGAYIKKRTQLYKF